MRKLIFYGAWRIIFWALFSISVGAQERSASGSRILVFPTGGEAAFSGYFMSADADTLVVESAGEKKLHVSRLAKVVVVKRGKRGTGFEMGTLWGTYFASFLWSEQGAKGLPSMFAYDYGSGVWQAIIGIGVGGGLGELLAPGRRQDTEEEFVFPPDSATRRKEWERFQALIQSRPPERRFRIAFCGAAVTTPNEDDFKAKAENAKLIRPVNTVRYADVPEITNFNLLRSVYCSYRYLPWLDVGGCVVSLSERFQSLWFYGYEQIGSALISKEARQSKSGMGLYVTAALASPLEFSETIEARAGVGLGAALTRYERYGSITDNQVNIQNNAQTQTFTAPLPSLLLFADVSWYIFRSMSLGFYADIAFASPVTIDATPLLPAQTLVVGNSGAGFRLGFRF